MRVNSINSAMTKKNSTAFGSNKFVRDKVADAFPLGVKVKSTFTDGENVVRITFPEADPLPSIVARALVNDETLAYENKGGCLHRVWDVEGVKTVDALILRTKRAVQLASTALREYVQDRSTFRMAQLAEEAAKKI